MACVCRFRRFTCMICLLYVQCIVFGLCSSIILFMAATNLDKVETLSLLTFDMTVFKALPISLIVSGCLMIVVAVCAFAISTFVLLDTKFRARVAARIRYVTCTFALFLLIILLLQIISAAYGLIVLMEEIIRLPSLEDIFKPYIEGTTNMESVDIIQKKMSCCGISSSKDYLFRGVPIPSSCCGKSEGICREYVYESGCWQKIGWLRSSLSKDIFFLSVTAPCISFVVIIAFVFAMILMCVKRTNPGKIYNSLETSSGEGE